MELRATNEHNFDYNTAFSEYQRKVQVLQWHVANAQVVCFVSGMKIQDLPRTGNTGFIFNALLIGRSSDLFILGSPLVLFILVQIWYALVSSTQVHASDISHLVIALHSTDLVFA